MRALKSLFNVFIIISVIVCAVPSINCSAESDKPAAAADVSVLSKYVWRGFELSNDSLVVQPSLTVSYKGVGINLGRNLDTEFDDRDPATSDESSLNETDLTVSYDRTFGSFSLGAGYIYYALDGLSDSQEVYASLGLDTLLAPTVKIYREIAHTPAWYVSLGISHS
ncbi:MAG: hypothetical protein PHW41_09420, partial [Eubacteriales bacterium]|nr:hypothetical protein [Eubacteriales bacterium]